MTCASTADGHIAAVGTAILIAYDVKRLIPDCAQDSQMTRRRSRGTITLHIRMSPSRAGEFNLKRDYRKFLKEHRTTHRVGRSVRRGTKRGVGYLYRKL